jgi:hypothetical protein
MDMDQQITRGEDFSGTPELEEVREAIAQVQSSELMHHSHAYDRIHQKLEDALKLIDGI